MKMMKSLLTFFLVIGGLVLFAQPPSSEAKYDKKYERRVKKEMLNGVYIPKDLADAFVQLNKLIGESSKKKFKSMTEEQASTKLHFSFGRWVSRNWGFYEGSRFSHYLRSLELYNPDDMTKFVLISYHRYLTKKPLEVKALLAVFKEKRDEIEMGRKNQGKVIFEETRKLTPEEVKAAQKKN